MLKIYNTLYKKKQIFKPLEGNKVSIYVCGMTVYDHCHLGHGRNMVAFDVIVRWLRFINYDVNYVRNITDIDDKIILCSQKNNESCENLTNRMILSMHEDESKLNILRPNVEPRATEHISNICSMIQTLIEKDYAYLSKNGDVYYRVEKFSSYGRLSRKNIATLYNGVRVKVNKLKENQLDFVLWKKSKPGEPAWISPWSLGRPGWHIECSAMSTSCLGKRFDIHGGGNDLQFPHHENEIAQAEAATDHHYANFWTHCGMIRINGEKMSKSLNNFFTIKSILKKYHPEVVRYFLTFSHYRSPIDFSEENLVEAKNSVERFYFCLRNLPLLESPPADNNFFRNRFLEAMNDDFNTPEAFAVLFDMVREINILKKKSISLAASLAVDLKGLAKVLGILRIDANDFFQERSKSKAEITDIDRLINKRIDARKNKDWMTSDKIREDLSNIGVHLEDSENGTTWRYTN